MIPIPFCDFVPEGFKQDELFIAFCNKMNSIMEGLKTDTLGLNSFIDPAMMPAQLLDNLGYYLNAGLSPLDSETTKRYKISYAIQGHKRRGSWAFDAKPKVDSVCGGNSQIIRAFDKDDWILVGDGLTPSSYYWAALGADGIDTDLGISLIGAGDEIEVSGNIYIDVDNSALTASEQTQLALALEDIVPAYYYVHLGYLNVSGQFIEYFVLG